MVFQPFSYTGELQNVTAVSDAVRDGLGSAQYCQVVTQLCDELKSLNKMEEGISAPQGLYHRATGYVLVCVHSLNPNLL